MGGVLCLHYIYFFFQSSMLVLIPIPRVGVARLLFFIFLIITNYQVGPTVLYYSGRLV